MPTYQGRNIVAIPTSPLAPAHIEIAQVDATAMNRSPFTGQQQILDWNATWMEATVTMPTLTYSQGQAWIAFLRALKGQACVFQFTAAFIAAFPEVGGTGIYWCLKSPSRKWSLSPGKLYGMSFEILQVP